MALFYVIFFGLLLIDPLNAASGSTCPLEEDITNIARCIQVDVTAIIYAVRGQEDLTSFCQLADRYMECFKTYTRGCVGFHFAEGALTELQNIALYCCQGIFKNPDCPLNTNVRKCFSQDSNVILSDGSHKLIGSLEVGDKVKTIDSNGELIDTDVIMIMDKSSQKSMFLNIKTYSNKSLRVSGSHLMPLSNGEFKFAKKLFKNDDIITFDFQSNKTMTEKIQSIIIEPIEGYIAPLTMSGTILVNEMLASCYAVIDSHTLAHAAMAPVRWWHLMDFDRLSSPKNGTHWYPQALMKISDTLLNKFLKLD